jgi:hypothetical protein
MRIFRRDIIIFIVTGLMVIPHIELWILCGATIHIIGPHMNARLVEEVLILVIKKFTPPQWKPPAPATRYAQYAII